MLKDYNDCFLCDTYLTPLYQVNTYLPDEDSQYSNSKIITKPLEPISMAKRINHSLYWKYAQSAIYYYSQAIENVIVNQRDSKVIKFNDDLLYNYENEFLRRFYDMDEYASKIQIFTEYYKYHQDIPRWGLNGILIKLMDQYYDGKRKITYYRIQNIINQQNLDNPDKTPKGLVGTIHHKYILGEKPQQSRSFTIQDDSSPNESPYISDFLGNNNANQTISNVEVKVERNLKTQYTNEMSEQGQTPIIFHDYYPPNPSQFKPRQSPVKDLKKKISTSPPKGVKINKWDLAIIKLTLLNQLNAGNNIQRVNEPKKEQQLVKSPSKMKQTFIKKSKFLKIDDAYSKNTTPRTSNANVMQRRLTKDLGQKRSKQSTIRSHEKQLYSTRSELIQQSPTKSLANSNSPEMQRRLSNFKESLKQINPNALQKLFKFNEQGLYLLWKKKANKQNQERIFTKVYTTPKSYPTPRYATINTDSNPVTSRTNDRSQSKLTFSPVTRDKFMRKSPSSKSPQKVQPDFRKVSFQKKETKKLTKKPLLMNLNYKKKVIKQAPKSARQTPISRNNASQQFTFKIINSKRGSHQIDWSKNAIEQVMREQNSGQKK